jgi:hypothetical protein
MQLSFRQQTKGVLVRGRRCFSLAKWLANYRVLWLVRMLGNFLSLPFLWSDVRNTADRWFGTGAAISDASALGIASLERRAHSSFRRWRPEESSNSKWTIGRNPRYLLLRKARSFARK